MSYDRDKLIQLYKLRLLRKLYKKKLIRRTIWCREWLSRRDTYSCAGTLNMLENELLTEDEKSYTNFLRMNQTVFNKLLEKVGSNIAKQNTVMRQSISAKKRLSLTLRYLATGESHVSLSYSTRIAKNTIGGIVMETVNAIISCLMKDYLKIPDTQEEWEKIAADFYDMWQFPNCLGAMDGKHITFRPRRADGAFYHNYKGTDSIVLLGVCDAKYRFICVDVGQTGRMSDGGVYNNSKLSSAIKTNALNFPDDITFPNSKSKIVVPHVFIADDAFALSERLMKPFRNRLLTKEELIYNYRVSRARRVIENAFGILANRFRILLNTMNLCVNKVEKITQCCVILHNFLLIENNLLYINNEVDKIDDIGNIIEGSWRSEEFQFTSLTRQSGNRTSVISNNIRTEYMRFFNNEGAVDWQNKAIQRGNI